MAKITLELLVVLLNAIKNWHKKSKKIYFTKDPREKSEGLYYKNNIFIDRISSMKKALFFIFFSQSILFSMDHLTAPKTNMHQINQDTTLVIPWCPDVYDTSDPEIDYDHREYNKFVRDMEHFSVTYKGKLYKGRSLFAAVCTENIPVLRYCKKAAQNGLSFSNVAYLKALAKEQQLNLEVLSLLIEIENIQTNVPVDPIISKEQPHARQREQTPISPNTMKKVQTPTSPNQNNFIEFFTWLFS